MVFKFNQVDDIWSQAFSNVDYLIEVQSNLPLWCLTHLNVNLFDHEIETIEKITDLNCKYILLVASRSGGKTHSTSVGIIKLCLDHAPFSVGVFAPKAEQAGRLLKQVKEILMGSQIKDEILWAECNLSKIVFKNGSVIVSNSASEVSNVEGIHVDCLVVDEAHKVSDLSVSQKLLPMVASSKIGKIIKLGVPLYKNHFWRSFNDTQYEHLVYDWTKTPNLLKGGSVIVKGKEYSKYVIDRMPLQMKQIFFSDNPELWTSSDTTEIDFKTQYQVIWVDDLNLVLTELDQNMLFSGEHDSLQSGSITDTYYAGLDTAGGSARGSNADLDYTSLAIWRKRADQVKEKVAHYEWRGDVTQAINEIYELINPVTGRFKCKFTLVDYSNIGINLVESYKNNQIPIEGITFNTTEANSGRNYKNAMMDQFLFELRAGRIKYPKADVDKSKMLKKCQNEWCLMERHQKLGINDTLGVPEDSGHDDTCCADLLGIWAADRNNFFVKPAEAPVTLDSLPSALPVNSAMNPTHNVTNRPKWLDRLGFPKHQ
jgi:hypothetical protein